MKKYILNSDGDPVEADLLTWAQWLENADRVVAFDKLDRADISTVFLGIDHRFGDGPPLLYETMIFGGAHEGHQCRYSTRDEALLGHSEAVKMVKESA